MVQWVMLVVALTNLVTALINLKIAKKRKDADRAHGQHPEQ